MKHITRWRPDTCACVLELEWDDEHPEDAREHRPVKIERCAAHEHRGCSNEHVFGVVHAENRHKNRTHTLLLEAGGAEHVDTLPNGVKRLKHEAHFTFDAERALRVTFPNAPEHLKPTLDKAAKAAVAKAAQ